MKSRVLSVSVLFCLAVWVRPCFGQGSTWVGTGLTEMMNAARWRVGELRVNAALNLNNLGYDTDIYYGYLGGRTPDFTLTASTPIQALLPISKKVVLELDETPSYLFYSKTKRERAWNNEFKGRIHFALEKLYLGTGGGSSNIRRRMSPELDINVREKSDRLEGTLLWQASKSASVALLYNYAKYDYGQAEFSGINLAETLNREESFADFIYYFQPSTKVRLFADGQYGNYRFSETTATVRDTRSYGAFGGLALIPREERGGPLEPPQGSISMGYKRFDVIDPAFKDGSGIVGSVDFSVGIFKRTSIRAFLTRDFAFSVFSTASYYLSTSLGGGLSRRLSRRSTFLYDVSFSWGQYPQAESALPISDLNFRYTDHSFGLNIRLARDLAMTLQATLGKRLFRGESRRRDFFGLSLVYGVSPASISAPTRGLSR